MIREEDGSPNPCEFFAAASEVYFDQPKELHKSKSAIYRQLNSFYKLNTSYWEEEEVEEESSFLLSIYTNSRSSALAAGSCYFPTAYPVYA